MKTRGKTAGSGIRMAKKTKTNQRTGRQVDNGLSEHESRTLAMILRYQPTTLYHVRKLLDASPTTSFSTSPGKMYPIIDRLKARGLVEASPVEGDGRNTEMLTATKAGKAAVKSWVKSVQSAQLLPDDPLRTRMMFADYLTKTERDAWLRQVREGLVEKLAEVEAYAEKLTEEPAAEANENALFLTRARIAWVDRLLQSADA